MDVGVTCHSGDFNRSLSPCRGQADRSDRSTGTSPMPASSGRSAAPPVPQQNYGGGSVSFFRPPAQSYKRMGRLEACRSDSCAQSPADVRRFTLRGGRRRRIYSVQKPGRCKDAAGGSPAPPAAQRAMLGASGLVKTASSGRQPEVVSTLAGRFSGHRFHGLRIWRPAAAPADRGQVVGQLEERRKPAAARRCTGRAAARAFGELSRGRR